MTTRDKLMRELSPLLVLQADGSYSSADGMLMKRENGKTPNGNDMNDRWVLRDPAGSLIDFDQFRHDLAERANVHLEEHDHVF
jgi:hypothetical protein